MFEAGYLKAFGDVKIEKLLEGGRVHYKSALQILSLVNKKCLIKSFRSPDLVPSSNPGSEARLVGVDSLVSTKATSAW